MFSFLSFVPIIGKLFDAVSAYFVKVQDVKLEKYKVDGTVDVSLINADTAIVQAQAALQAAGRQYLGTRVMQYGFVYPLIAWFGMIIVYCIVHPYLPNTILPVLALPDPLRAGRRFVGPEESFAGVEALFGLADVAVESRDGVRLEIGRRGVLRATQ